MQTPTSSSRIQSIDWIKGLVMILMAIDHVRVYSGVPAGGPDPGIFFTRWITHFCAPAFVFFAGTSAFFYGVKVNSKRQLARFLLTRGLYMIFLEFTLIKFLWTFELDYSSFVLAGVIWMLGCCMIVLAALTYCKLSVIAAIGLVLIFGQRLFGWIPSLLPVKAREVFGVFWEFIYTSGLKGPDSITILYVLIPWIGVMAVGYTFGHLLQQEENRRNKYCLQIGLSAIAVFLVVGSIVAWRAEHQKNISFIFRLLHQQKYPASELFLLMTLGPCLAILPWANHWKGTLSDKIRVFGKVPMFYYILHIPVIHFLALLTNKVVYGQYHSEWYQTAPYTFVKPEQRWSLALLYLIFAFSIVILYSFCKKYVNYKEANKDKKWLSYI